MARWSQVRKGMRKVRAPQGRVLANDQSRWLEGKCNRKLPPTMLVRMKRRGKSSPSCRWLREPCKPHLVQENATISSLLVAKSLERIGNSTSRQMIIKYRTRLTDHLAFFMQIFVNIRIFIHFNILINFNWLLYIIFIKWAHDKYLSCQLFMIEYLSIYAKWRKNYKWLKYLLTDLQEQLD